MSRVCLLVVCALLGVASRASAQSSTAAKPHVDAGVTAYKAADYETALREFELAYGIDEDPMLLYAWAQAQRQGGHCDQAIEQYRRYIDSKPTDEQIAAANTGIALCKQTPALPPEKAPPPPLDPVPQQPSDSSPWYKDRLGGGLVIGGVASAAIGATFLVLSSRSADAASEAGSRAEFLDHLDDATLHRRIGIVGLGIGSGLAIAGIVRYVTRGDEPSNSAGIAVTSGGTSVLLFGRF